MDVSFTSSSCAGNFELVEYDDVVKTIFNFPIYFFQERVMKNPSSVTELMSWWSKFSVPIDDEDVKSNFIEKVKSHDKRSTNRRIIHSSVKVWIVLSELIDDLLIAPMHKLIIHFHV